MKKILLSLSFVALSLSINAQTFQNDNFNSLTIGNVGTDFTGTTPGQNSWSTFSTNVNSATSTTSTSTNAGNSNFQIVANGNSSTNGFSLETPNGNEGARYMWKEGFDTFWASRTAGNNRVEVQYDIFSGPTTTSKGQVSVRLFALDGTTSRTVSGFNYTLDTKVLSGLAYLNNGGTYGTFLVNLDTAGALTLAPNTWYTIGFGYDTVTGAPYWRINTTTASFSVNPANYAGPYQPVEVDFIGLTVATNTVAGTNTFDNFTVKATSGDSLLGNDEFATIAQDVISVYPNPAKDVINVNSSINSFNSVSIVDLNGRVVKSLNFNAVTEAQINISDLASGIYVMNINSEKETFSKKIVIE